MSKNSESKKEVRRNSVDWPSTVEAVAPIVKDIFSDNDNENDNNSNLSSTDNHLSENYKEKNKESLQLYYYL